MKRRSLNVGALIGSDLFVKNLKCISCSAEYAYGKLFSCDACHELLDVVYDMESVANAISKTDFGKGHSLVEKYSILLPVKGTASPVSLEEGNTPLLSANRLGQIMNIDKLYVKDETRNPTGTFKDRSVSVGVTVARENDVVNVSTASTGNAGASLAAYAAKAGMKCRVILPATASTTKLIQAMAYGATILPIDGPVDVALKLLKEAFDAWAWYPIPTSGPINPYQLEGAKTIAYEISMQLKDDPPDWVLYPICGGDNVAANWKGFKELDELDIGCEPPKLVGVQASACASLVEALRNGHERIRPVNNPHTAATSICIEHPPTGLAALRAIRESEGVAIGVTDDEMFAAQSLLAAKGGVFAELASASVVAALQHLVNQGTITRDETVVCVITGTGLKETEPLRRRYVLPSPLPPTKEALSEFA